MTTPAPVSILLVDDQPAKLLSYEVMLSGLGEKLIKVSSPQEALATLLKTDDIALVLIDVVMPELDGFQLAAMIREHPRFQQLAMIFVSAVQIAESDALRGYQSGAVDYVAVPVVPEVLRAKVKVFTELYRKSRQLEALNAELEQRVAARTAELEAQTERLRQSEERRSLALSAADMGSWELDVTSGRFIWDDGQYRIFGVEPGRFEPSRAKVAELIHPEDRAACSLATDLDDVAARYKQEFRVIKPSGEVRWCFGAATPTRAEDGTLLRLNGVTIDITERKRAGERQVLLAREVDHRAKNTLAVVLSVLKLTRAESIKDFVGTVEGRIQALAATHNLLSATRWEGADLRRIVEEEMAPYEANHRQRIATEGAPVVLLPATAQAVALALHELATNAAKYGALSNDTGHLRVSWSIGTDALVLDWDESGGPATAEPKSLGFGLTIVRSSIEEQFRGGVVYQWRPEGLHCRLSIPRAQIAEPARPPVSAQPAAKPGPLSGRLAGKRILVVEDEFLVAMLVGNILGNLGATAVGPYGRLADAIEAAGKESFDGAVLDLNLHGESAEPLADRLNARGVPFLFITGYQREGLDRRYDHVPVLAKPIDAAALAQALNTLLSKTRSLEQVA